MTTARRYRVFETDDADEALVSLSQPFGQKTSITRLSPTSLTSLSLAHVSRLLLMDFRSTHDLVIVRDNPMDVVAVNVPLHGYFRSANSLTDEVTVGENSGAILSMEGSSRGFASGYQGLVLIIPRPALQEGLESLIGKTANVDFDLALDCHSSGGGLISSAIKMVAEQLGQAQSPLGHPAVAARFEEFIVNALLHGQPHNYLEAIANEQRAATPKQVRRAEDYIHAHIGEAVRLSQIAAAAGCSVRSLQLAFRMFRNTTPIAMLKQARLEQAHAELLDAEPDATTVTEIAVKYGFYNLGRFAQDHKRVFGQSPSEVLRLNPARKHSR